MATQMNPESLFDPPDDQPVGESQPRSGAKLDAHAESVALLTLAGVRGVGFRTLHKLFLSRVSFDELVQTDSRELCRQTLEDVKVKGAERIAQDVIERRDDLRSRAVEQLSDLESNNVRLIHWFDPEFPSQLEDLSTRPGWLFVQGDHRLLHRPAVAIVGTREPSFWGRFLADLSCVILAGSDVVTVSGLAEGVDQRAHAASLSTGIPTIAVLGTGISHNYPASSHEMRREMLDAGGCVVSEYFPESGPDRQRFVLRNRIQAALASITIPVEWKLKSGTAHTVRFALEAGRTVIGLRVRGRDTPENEHLKRQGMMVFTMPTDTDVFQEFVFTRLTEHDER